jgi:phosphohistidine phosphatase SixA
VWLAALWLLVAAPADADGRLWPLLEGGGQVVLIRHGLTTPGAGDPDGFRLEDCATQRNLNEEGRQQSRRLGEVFRARRIPVERVLSSPWCRCVETARLAFGGSEPWAALGNLFGRPERRDEQVRHMRARVSESRAGGNLVLVTHGATIEALTGINPGTAEMVIVTPRGGGAFAVAGRLGIRQASMRRVMELAERSCYNPPSSSRRPVDHRRQS